jgi:hypothetical protein
MISVLSIPSVTSIVWIEPRSICEYERTAATSSVIRRVDSFTSPRSVAAESVLATHSRPGSTASPSTTATRSHHSTPAPAAANGGAISQSCSMPWSSSQSEILFSSSARSTGSGTVARGPSSRRRSSSTPNWAAVTSPSASRRSADSNETQAVSRALTERAAAAAGLLISCASPAASVPSVIRASRCRAVDSIARAVP